MRDILKRIFIGVAIGMALFFIKEECFALNIQYYRHQVQYTKLHADPIVTDTSSWTDQGSPIVLFANPIAPTTAPWSVDYVAWTVGATSSANGFLANYTYLISFNLTTNNIFKNGVTFNFSSNSGVGSCTWAESTSSGVYNISCTITPPQNTAFLSVYIRPINGYVFTGTYSQNISNSKVTELPNYDAITATTNQVISSSVQNIESALNGAKNEISASKDILVNFWNYIPAVLNGTITGGNVIGPGGSTPYTSSGLHGAESGLYNTSDQNSFSLNSSDYSTPFAFIWSIVQSFLSSQSSVIFVSAITFVLTLSFASLVIGRL